VVPSELAKLVGAVTAYNAHISAQATAHGWAYYDPNPALDSLKAIPTAVAPFPAIGAACSANPFGTAFSCDGVHPSAATHRLIATKLRDAINAAYSTAIPPIP
jgi:lysophospholipase L1-like esterase